jgi:hypothetical protein
MTKKQRMNYILVACWELSKKYLDKAPLTEKEIEMLLNDATKIANQYGNTKFVKRVLHATCDEICEGERDHG